VVTFEYLTATPADQSLLSLTARYPGAQVVNGPPPAGPTGGKQLCLPVAKVSGGLLTTWGPEPELINAELYPFKVES
jgi:hypothetical protein